MTSASRAIERAKASETEEFHHDREFSVVTDFVVFSVATGKSLSRHTSQGLLSRQSLPGPVSRQSSMCRDRALGLGRSRHAATESLVRETTRAWCPRSYARDRPATMHCLGHCSWALFKK